MAKSIILCKVSSITLSIIPNDISITVWEIWTLLANLYDRNDISLQFTIQNQIATLKMHGAADAEKYMAAHTAANECLAQMGVRLSDGNAIYALLRGLLSTGLWPLVRKTIKLEMQCNIQAVQAYETTMNMDGTNFNAHTRGTSTTSAPPSTTSRFGSMNPFLALICSTATVRPYTFQDAASTIVSKATQMLNESSLPGPRSEYANIAQNSRGENLNPVTGL